MNATQIALFGTALILGLRHGIDWDHIAAITDISGTGETKRDALVQGFTYALGHASIIIAFGLLAVLFGIQLPSWVDSVMEPIVGLTLVILGAWLLFTIVTKKEEARLVSRWALLFEGIENLKHKLFHSHSHTLPSRSVGLKNVFGIGMIHGIGAETPTQLLLFVTAAGIGGGFIGSLLVLFFVAGLITSNTLITLIATFGFKKVQKNPRILLILGGISGAFSILVGVTFLLGHASTLPSLLGG